jgi:hypothetical protein
VWQLATPIAPSIAGARATIAGARTLTIERVAPAQAAWSATDLRSVDADFTGGHRLDTVMPGGDHRYLHVLWIGGAASGVSPQAEGVALQLEGGRTASLRFERDGIGGSLSIDGLELTLGPGVDPLDE